MSDSRVSFQLSPSGTSQAPAAKRLRVYAKRVPSYLRPDRQREAVRQVRAGQFVHHVAQEFGVAESVIHELFARDLERRLRDLAANLDAKIDALDADLRGRGARVAKGAAA